MELNYKKATLDDINILADTRVEVLRAANRLGASVDMSEVRSQSLEYYLEAFKDNNIITYLVFDKENFAGSGSVCFYRVMPTFHNPSGYKAYIMNMYTNPAYRRRGIAYKILDLLVNEARNRNISCISLEATDMGRPLYEKYGFKKMNSEMELPN